MSNSVRWLSVFCLIVVLLYSKFDEMYIIIRLLAIYLIWRAFDYFFAVIHRARQQRDAEQQYRQHQQYQQYQQRTAQSRQGISRLEMAYQVMGISPQSTDDEVRQAYRRMAMLYHPDRLGNVSEDVRQAAVRKFQELGQARDMVYAARGMK